MFYQSISQYPQYVAYEMCFLLYSKLLLVLRIRIGVLTH